MHSDKTRNYWSPDSFLFVYKVQPTSLIPTYHTLPFSKYNFHWAGMKSLSWVTVICRIVLLTGNPISSKRTCSPQYSPLRAARPITAFLFIATVAAVYRHSQSSSISTWVRIWILILSELEFDATVQHERNEIALWQTYTQSPGSNQKFSVWCLYWQI